MYPNFRGIFKGCRLQRCSFRRHPFLLSETSVCGSDSFTRETPPVWSARGHIEDRVIRWNISVDGAQEDVSLSQWASKLSRRCRLRMFCGQIEGFEGSTHIVLLTSAMPSPLALIFQDILIGIPSRLSSTSAHKRFSQCFCSTPSEWSPFLPELLRPIHENN